MTTTAEPLWAIGDCLDGLRAGLSRYADNDLVQQLRDLEVVSRRVYAVMLDAVAEIDARGLGVQRGFGSTARLLAGLLHVSAADARTRVEQAALLRPHQAMTGECLPPVLPVTAAALAAGQIGTGQLRVITDTLATLPASVPALVREQVEADLAKHAREFDLADCAPSPSEWSACWTRTDPHPPTIRRLSRHGGSCGCVTVATAASAWTAGSTPNTARCSAR